MDIAVLQQREVPDEYVELITHMKFFIEPNISCSRFLGAALFTKESLEQYQKDQNVHVLIPTEMGEFLQKNIHGKVFIDVPCGNFDLRDQDQDFREVELMGALGVRDYVEVDKDLEVLGERLSGSEKRKEGDVSITAFQDDLLRFLSKISEDLSKVIYISALQADGEFSKDPKNQESIIVPYLEALYKEIDRVCSSNDLVILNSSDMLVAGIDEEKFPAIHPIIALAKKGFTLKRRCQQDKVHVFQKD